MRTKIIKPKNTKLTTTQIKIVEETSIEFVNLIIKDGINFARLVLLFLSKKKVI